MILLSSNEVTVKSEKLSFVTLFFFKSINKRMIVLPEFTRIIPK